MQDMVSSLVMHWKYPSYNKSSIYDDGSSFLECIAFWKLEVYVENFAQDCGIHIHFEIRVLSVSHSMGLVSPLLMHWRCCSPALSH